MSPCEPGSGLVLGLQRLADTYRGSPTLTERSQRRIETRRDSHELTLIATNRYSQTTRGDSHTTHIDAHITHTDRILPVPNVCVRYPGFVAAFRMRFARD